MSDNCYIKNKPHSYLDNSIENVRSCHNDIKYYQHNWSYRPSLWRLQPVATPTDRGSVISVAIRVITWLIQLIQ